MAVQVSTLEKHLDSLRRLEEHRTAESERAIRRTFKALLKDLKQFLGVEYANFADDDALTYEILQRKGQYARFLEEIEMRISGLSPATVAEIQTLVEETYTASYEGMATAVRVAANSEELSALLAGVHVTPEIIKRAVENPIAGLTLKDTLERFRREIVYNIKRQITAGLLNGDRMSSMARRIAGSLDKDYRKAITIARTEAGRAREGGFQQSASNLNEVLKSGTTSLQMHKRWKTMQDEKVRKGSKANHRKMNGVSIPVDDYFDLGRGVKTLAPKNSGDAANDINCRCILIYELKPTE